MATFSSTKYTAEAAQASPIGGGHGLQGVVRAKQAVIAVGIAAAAADVLNFFYAPAGARAIGWKLESDDLDTNGSPTITLDVGIPGETDKFFDGSTVAQAGTAVDDEAVQADARNYKFTENTLITGTVAAAGTTKAAGNVTLTMFYMQEDFETS